MLILNLLKNLFLIIRNLFVFEEIHPIVIVIIRTKSLAGDRNLHSLLIMLFAMCTT